MVCLHISQRWKVICIYMSACIHICVCMHLCIYVYFRSKNINFPGKKLGLKTPQGLIWGDNIHNFVY